MQDSEVNTSKQSQGKPITVLSLGAGVQSTALLLMSIRGVLPRIDHAIFADTQYEPPAVYRHLEWLKEEAATAGIPLTVLTAGDLRKDAIDFRSGRASNDGKRHASIPLFVLNGDGTQGLIRRQCTSEYKIVPIERFLKRSLLGLAPYQRAPTHPVIRQWFGITWDERRRIKPSRDKWKVHVYPFCSVPEAITPLWVRSNGMPRLWTRQDCIRWLAENYPGREIPRSACICCPYRSNKEWRQMRDADPASFADAVRFDEEMRDADAAGQTKRKMLVGLPFVHRSMVPLGAADIEDDGPGFWDGVSDNECEGMCGV